MKEHREGIKVKGYVTVRLYGPDGKLKMEETTENGITTIGFENMVDHISTNGGAVLSHLGVGWGAGANNAFAIGQTDLQGANKDRKATSPVKVNATNWKVTNQWIANQPSSGTWPVPIEEIGTFWGASGPNMFSRTVRAVINKEQLDTLEIEYRFVIQ